MVKISIIIPTFNSEKFLKTTLHSIISQTYRNYEVIICDNCSKDQTKKIVQHYKRFNKNIFFFQKKDKGVAEALNFGFTKAKGQILCWLNSDDLYLHDSVLMNVSSEFNKKNFDYLVGNFINVNQNNKIIKSFYSFIPKKKIKYLFYYNQIFTGSLFFSKNSYKKFKSFDTNCKYAFEYDLVFFLLKNFEGRYINNFLSCFRILPTSLSSNKRLLNNEKNILIKKYSLFYTNSFILRFFSYLMNGNLIDVILNKLSDKYVASNINFLNNMENHNYKNY